jgi:hypothetical protein
MFLCIFICLINFSTAKIQNVVLYFLSSEGRVMTDCPILGYPVAMCCSTVDMTSSSTAFLTDGAALHRSP